jgi:hypothetical protein
MPETSSLSYSLSSLAIAAPADWHLRGTAVLPLHYTERSDVSAIAEYCLQLQNIACNCRTPRCNCRGSAAIRVPRKWAAHAKPNTSVGGNSSCVMQCCTTTHTSTSAQRTTSSPTALPKSPLHNSGSKCTISCSTFELQLIYLTLKDRGCNPLYYSITTAASQLHQPGDISVHWIYTLLVKQ